MWTALIWLSIAAACGCFWGAAALHPEGRNRRLTRMSLVVLGCLFVIGAGLVWNFARKVQEHPVPQVTKDTANREAR